MAAGRQAPVNVIVTEEGAPQRLDRFLQRRFPAWGRQAVQRLIASRQVQVNRRLVWLASWQVNSGDQITVAAPPVVMREDAPARFDDAWLLALEPDLVVVNKPAGLLAEPPRFRDAPNLHALAVARFGPLTLFHRLDRDTSGVLLLTRGRAVNQALDIAFKAHQVQKCYLALVAGGVLPPSGTVQVRLAPHPRHRDRMVVTERGGDWAVTRFVVMATQGDRVLVKLWPETGRTHQLRVHLAHLGAPILGDRLYGDADSAPRLMLHAWHLVLPPLLEQPARTFCAPLPPVFGEWGDVSL